MKLTILVDNNTFIDQYYYGEPGVSYLIEDDGCRVLFDVGYSNLFIRNASKMGLDLANIDKIVLSHGHNDHTGGLIHYIRFFSSNDNNQPRNKPRIISHPDALASKYDGESTGIPVLKDELSKHFNIETSKSPIWLNKRLVFLGEIERKTSFEGNVPMGKVIQDGKEVHDFMLDDSALVYKSSNGLVIITGCAHAGICNIIEYSKKVCKDDRIADIIGGFHLLSASNEQLQFTLNFLRDQQITELHACHCTDLTTKIALSQVASLKDVGVGLQLTYDEMTGNIT